MKLLVIAKAPVPGEVKTRLCPPLTSEQAAALARAALEDTLAAVDQVRGVEPVLVLHGDPGPWIPGTFTVIPQRGDGLAERIASAFDDAGGPAFLVGMDTPQVTPRLLSEAVRRLAAPGVDAVLGLAEDGGWWGVGLRHTDPRVFEDVPMSTRGTGAAQQARLMELGLVVDGTLPVLRDVDRYEDAVAVAACVPESRFGAAVAATRLSTRRWVTPTVLAVGAGLIVAANRRGEWLRDHGSYQMWVNAPPLTGTFDPLVTPRSIAAVVMGGLGVWVSDRAVRRLSWRSLLWVALAAALAWAVALAFWDGVPGFIRAARATEGYATALPAVGDAPGAFVRGFVAHVRDYSAHVQAHPPGMVLVLWAMERLGLGGPWWESALQLTAAASSVPAVLLAVREVGGQDRARAAAPFLVLAPSAVAWSSGDGMFMGVGAWAAALLILATGRRGRRADVLAFAGGLAAGAGLMLSYGLVLLGLVPLTVIVARRRWRVAAIAALPIAAVLAGFATAGFWWLAGLRATRKLYHEGIALRRPQSYFVWANLAALAIAVGPAVWVGLARLRDRRLWLLAGAALAAIALADLSGLSKAEVERIWLPFVPWLLAAAATAFVTLRERRGWLSAQVGTAVLVQWLVRSSW